MSESIDYSDDPRLTAYVLGELSEAERAEVEQQLAACPDSRAYVEGLQATTAELFTALQREPLPALRDDQRQAILTAAPAQLVSGSVRRSSLIVGSPTEPGRPRTASRTAVLVAGGVTVVAASLLALMIPLNSRDNALTSERLLARNDVNLNLNGRWDDVAEGMTADGYFVNDLRLTREGTDFDVDNLEIVQPQHRTAGAKYDFTPPSAGTTHLSVTDGERALGLSELPQGEAGQISEPLMAERVATPAPGDVSGGAITNFTREQLGRAAGEPILNKRPMLREGEIVTTQPTGDASTPSSGSGEAQVEMLGQVIAGPTPEPAYRRALQSHTIRGGEQLPGLGAASSPAPVEYGESEVRQRMLNESRLGEVDKLNRFGNGAVANPQGVTTWGMPSAGPQAAPSAGKPVDSPADTRHYYSLYEQKTLGDEVAPAMNSPVPATPAAGGYGGSLGGMSAGEGARLEAGGQPIGAAGAVNRGFEAQPGTPFGVSSGVADQSAIQLFGSEHPTNRPQGQSGAGPVDASIQPDVGAILMATPRIVVQEEEEPLLQIQPIQLKMREVDLKDLEKLHLQVRDESRLSSTVADPNSAATTGGVDALGTSLPDGSFYLGAQVEKGRGVDAGISSGQSSNVWMDLSFPKDRFGRSNPQLTAQEGKTLFGTELARETAQRGYRFVQRGEVQTPPAGGVPVASDFGVGWMVPGTEAYQPIVENQFQSADTAPFSTFGLDVDTASYANVRRFLMGGQWPPPDAVRLEEMINYFHYDDLPPVDEHPLACHLETAACPWNTNHQLVRIGLVGKTMDMADRPPTTLVFLVDTSGSMRDDNKLPLVQDSLKLLTRELTENDRIAIVTYSDEAHALLESTRGDQHDEIIGVIDSLNANGSTNGEGGLKLAYDVATRHFIDYGTNRVILCTDGDFNVGESEDAPLVQLISEKRKSGVFLSICGFGTGNIKDAKLEQIADKGNGQYHYVDGIAEARKVFLEDLAGMLYTLAKDVKLQVEFNPRQVTSYRLLGYENRLLAKEDFDNDQIDAGDMSAGHTVSALYEIVPVESPTSEERQTQASGRRESPDVEASPGADASAEPVKTAVVARQIGEAMVARGLDQGLFDIHVDQGTVTVRGMAETRAQADRYLDVLRSVAAVREVRDQLGVRQTAAADAPETDLGDNLLVVHLRYKQPRSDESAKLDFPLGATERHATPSAESRMVGGSRLVRDDPPQLPVSRAVVLRGHPRTGARSEGE